MVDRHFQIIIKISKYCNLRCRYCYEYPDLANPQVMTREQLASLYHNIRDYFIIRDERDGKITHLDFIWHGGEPLQQDPQLYWSTFQDQKEILGSRPLKNLVQTNLVHVDKERMRLLVEGFDGVGVSLDVAGGLRVNIAGRDPQDKVIKNLRALLDAKPRDPVSILTLRNAHSVKSIGAIAVLTARNLDAVDEIFRFYEKLGISFRICPLYDTGNPTQTAPFEITQEQEITALNRLVDLWLTSEVMVQPPTPLDRYVQTAARHIASQQGPVYQNRRDWLGHVLVDLDGQCYTQGDSYGDAEWSFGNLFTTQLSQMLTSDAFERCAQQAERRVALNCLTCPYFAACGGGPMADSEPRQRDEDSQGVLSCMARPVIDHIVQRLKFAAPHAPGDHKTTSHSTGGKKS